MCDDMEMLRIFIIFVCFWCAVTANSITVIDMLAKVVNICQQRYNVNLVDCMKERSLIALDYVYRSKNEINIVPDFVSLSRYDNFKIEERSGKVLPDDIDKQSPQNKTSILDTLILSRLGGILGSRAISVKVPITYLDFLNLLPRSEVNKEEGRKKDNRGLLPVLATMAGTMLILKLAAIGAIASKALMASMLAMTLATIAAFSKRGATHGSTYEVINVPANGHHSRRLYSENGAYSSQYHRGESLPHEAIEIDSI